VRHDARVARDPGFRLEQAIESVAFTPGARDLAPLLELLGGADEKLADRAERALLRAGAPAGRAAIARFGSASSPGEGRLRARLLRLIGRLAAGEEIERSFYEFLRERLNERDPRARRAAIVALGKLRGAGPELEAALLDAWDREEEIEERRALAAALGKVGGARARERLRSVVTEDRELRRIADEALLRLARIDVEPLRHKGIDANRAPPRPLPMVLRCRAGIEPLLLEELAGRFRGARVRGPGVVGAELAGPLADVLRLRTLLSFGFALPPEPIASGDAAEALARALTSPAADEVLGAFSDGERRYRIEWAGVGRRRATLVRAATRVGRARPELVNDPSRRDWEAVAFERAGAIAVELRPRLDDPRFAYRLGDVPAASHPTLAAALVRVAGARPGDVVWDPFAGSGTELAERLLAGPAARLVGTDEDPRAIEVARANLAEAARLAGREAPLELSVGDALSALPPKGLTTIVTNPPMGRRVRRGEDVGALLERFVERASAALPRGGRLVWISPLPSRTRAAAARAALSVERALRVDMGGFDAELQSLRRR